MKSINIALIGIGRFGKKYFKLRGRAYLNVQPKFTLWKFSTGGVHFDAENSILQCVSSI